MFIEGVNMMEMDMSSVTSVSRAVSRAVIFGACVLFLLKKINFTKKKNEAIDCVLVAGCDTDFGYASAMELRKIGDGVESKTNQTTGSSMDGRPRNTERHEE